ncbi:hypothetical protein E3U55_06050 [Filobacillus milosensis]|uniref:Uncharacterized protein n=1 Tax=Filobacillus milosensis TaxID=94137 RepID=A0A4Y8IQ47_9BACI|nr:hypothetical protein [Filobacillus milosensis]TFB22796.1 hypothetical protein E3U55_06050 [Filobacillus milosensis]
MLISAIILGVVGLVLYLLIFLTYRKLIQNNEHGFLHLIMALMYAMWLPLPIVLYQILNTEVLIIGAIFGMTYLIMMIMTMSLQTGHIVHIVKQEESPIWNERAEWLMTTLGSSVEGLANIFKAIWALFLAIAFWVNGSIVMAIILLVFQLVTIYYFINLLDQSLIKRYKFLEKFKPNPLIYNIEAFLFFLTLILYLSL